MMAMSFLSEVQGSRIRIINPLWWILFFCLSCYRFLSKFFPNRCRFIPTCSTYARGVLLNYGVTKSLFLIAKRLLKCHPFHPGGFDEVPTKSTSKQDVCCENCECDEESSK